MTVNRLCGSGLEAVCDAVRRVATGDADVRHRRRRREHDARAVRVRQDRRGLRRARRRRSSTRPSAGASRTRAWRRASRCMSMGETAENVGDEVGHRPRGAGRLRARVAAEGGAAVAAGAFEREIVPVPVPQKKGEPVVVREGRVAAADTTLEALAKLAPVFRKGGTVTAGNSSPINDGACGGARRERGRREGREARAARARRGARDGGRATRTSWARARSRRPQGARARGLDGRRTSTRRAQRGVRRAVDRVRPRARARPGAGQRARRRHRARPPDRVERLRASSARSSGRDEGDGAPSAGWRRSASGSARASPCSSSDERPKGESRRYMKHADEVLEHASP